MEHAEIIQLIEPARQGDMQARAALLGHFRDYLALLAHLHVRPLLQAKFDASDIVQETCLQAVQSFDQFRGSSERQLAAWLRQVMAMKGAWLARHYLGAEMRAVHVERRLQLELDQSSCQLAALFSASSESPSQHAMRREQSVLLANAIAKVQGDQREVLILHGLQGMTIRDVAATMNRSEASTWKLWARGLCSLRKFVGEEV